MAIGLITTVDDRRLRAAFERLSTVGRRPRRALGRIGLFVRRESARRLRSRPIRGGIFGTGQRSSGRLAKSLAMRLEDSAVTVGSNLKYAKIQQLGGVVLPRTVKCLAIPVLGSLARRGVWPRDLPADSMKFIPSKKRGIVGRLVRLKKEEVVIQRGPNKGKTRQVGKIGETMFLLVKRAKVIGRPYMLFGDAEQNFALREIEGEYRRAAKG